MKCLRPNRRGFTLIEMLVVVAIIGIMAGIGVPNFVALLRNHRTRSSAMTLLAELRKTRSRAVSLNRELVMIVDVDNTNKVYTYSVARLEYKIYDPLSVAMGTPEELWSEDSEVLEMNVSFNINKGLEKVIPSGSFSYTFHPSGTITMSGGATMSTIYLEGIHRHYEIILYKAGQVSFRVKST